MRAALFAWGVSLLALCAPAAAAADVPLTRIASDPFSNPGAQHATVVEPSALAFGSTIVAAAQAGRYFDGAASGIAFATSTDAGAANCQPGECRLDVSFASSADGGATWSTPTRLGDPMKLDWLANTSKGRFVGEYLATTFTSDRLAHPVFSLAKPPTDGRFDQALYTPSRDGGRRMTGLRHRSDDERDVIVVGAGLSRVAAGVRLQDLCPDKSYAILEARAAIGGTWDLCALSGAPMVVKRPEKAHLPFPASQRRSQ